MKKILGLVALTMAVSGIASAEQDFLKKISVDTNVRYQYQDRKGTDAKANEIGNEGFKQENRKRTRWIKSVSGEVHLSDEFGLDGDFSVLHRNQTIRAGHDRLNEGELWNVSLGVSKDVKLGSLDSTWRLGWTNETSKKLKENEVKVNGARATWNEITFGPSFSTKVLGQNVNVNTGLVYFTFNGGADENYIYSGNDFTRGKTEGWGINLGLSTGGTIYKGSLGSVTYGVGFGHFFRDANGTLTTGESAPSNVKLSYTQNVKYSTPSFKGLSGYVNFANEWTKHTVGTNRAGKTWENEFNIIPGVDYKTKLETSVGTLTVNPYVSYSALQRVSKYTKTNTENKRVTTEKNEIRAGLRLTLDVAR